MSKPAAATEPADPAPLAEISAGSAAAGISAGEAGSADVSTEAQPFRMRLGAGKYAVSTGEAEIRDLDGVRLAGGAGAFEFDLFGEAWVEIVVLR